VLNKLLDVGIDDFEGGLNTKRDIADLVSKNLIEQVEGTAGRSVRYVVRLIG